MTDEASNGDRDMRRADLFVCERCGSAILDRWPGDRQCAGCGSRELHYYGEISFENKELGSNEPTIGD